MTTVKDNVVKLEPKKTGVDLDKLVKKIQAAYGKDKSMASQISTGKHISRPDKDSDFIVWKNSFWEEMTGVRGIPFGKIVQIAGKPDSGKSSFACKVAKCAQDQGYQVLLWDTENKFNKTRFDKYFKGNSEDLLITSSRMILEGGDQIEKMVHGFMEEYPDKKLLLIWDSVGATLAKNSAQDSLLDGKQLASEAKENKSVLRALIRLMEQYKNRETNEERIAVLLINQSYANIGSVGQKESGGQGVEYFSSIILQLSRKSDLNRVMKGVKVKTGIVSRAKVKKNHLFEGEFSVAEMDIVVTAGDINRLSEKKIKSSPVASKGSFDDDDEELLEEDES